MAEANWYVVHTYSGYENKVKANIDKTIENRHLLGNLFFNTVFYLCYLFQRNAHL